MFSPQRRTADLCLKRQCAWPLGAARQGQHWVGATRSCAGPRRRHGTHTGTCGGTSGVLGGAGHRGQAWTRTSGGHAAPPGAQKGPSPRGASDTGGRSAFWSLGLSPELPPPSGKPALAWMVLCPQPRSPRASLQRAPPTPSGPLPCPSASVCPWTTVRCAPGPADLTPLPLLQVARLAGARHPESVAAGGRCRHHPRGLGRGGPGRKPPMGPPPCPALRAAASPWGSSHGQLGQEAEEVGLESAVRALGHRLPATRSDPGAGVSPPAQALDAPPADAPQVPSAAAASSVHQLLPKAPWPARPQARLPQAPPQGHLWRGPDIREWWAVQVFPQATPPGAGAGRGAGASRHRAGKVALDWGCRHGGRRPSPLRARPAHRLPLIPTDTRAASAFSRGVLQVAWAGGRRS